MILKKIRECVDLKNIKWSNHCLKRMLEREISRSDVLNCVMNGDAIKDYPYDSPFPSCLIFGYTLKNIVIHVVASADDNFAYIITAYYPDLNYFNEDLKTRR